MKTLLVRAVKGFVLLIMFNLCAATVRAQDLMPLPDPYLDSWSFYDPTNWFSDRGYAPVGFTTNIVCDTSCWSSDDGVLDCNGLILDTTNAAYLNYNVVENDGYTNLICSAGTLWFWFSPDWSSTNQGGTGPGNWGQFIDAGAWTSNADVGYWGLSVDAAGDNIYFSGQTNGAGTNYLNYPISWSAGSWHLIGLTYSTTNSVLYVDGQLATNGIGVSYWPGEDTITNGIWIGSDALGNSQARGEFVDIETYSDAFSTEYPTDFFSNYYNQMQSELPGGSFGGFGGGFGDFMPPSGGFGVGGGGGAFWTNSIYGTNLWLYIDGVSNNLAGLFLMNTAPDVLYEIQSTTNLAQLSQFGWTSEGFVYGPETTNYVEMDVNQSNRPDLFMRIRSWMDTDGVGIPDWWQFEYFGTNGVNPNSDPVGDGWTLLQDFQNGFNPTNFVTPPTIQGLTANLNQASNTATVSWLPNSGNVTNYTVEKTDTYSDTVEDFNVSSNATSYLDNISGDMPDPDNGNTYDVSYQVWANYSNGSSSPLGASVQLQSTTLNSWIFPGTNGITYLTLDGLPSNAVDVVISGGSFSNEIPVSNFTNGLCQLPANWSSNGISYIHSVDANGNPSASSVISPYGWSAFDLYGNFQGSGGNPAPVWGYPFFDGRVQLKQNLSFLLRAATISQIFSYYPTNFNPTLNVPTNYVYASYNVVGTTYNLGSVDDEADEDVLAPFELNYFYRNFVYDTGAFNSYDLVTNGFYLAGTNVYPLVSPAYQFKDGTASFTPLLGTNQTEWLAAGNYLASQNGSDIGIPSSFSMSSGAKNFYGLSFLSAQIAQTSSSNPQSLNYLAAGDSLSPNANDLFWTYYPETAQPQYQTVEYDFWAPFDQITSTSEYSQIWILRAPQDAYELGYGYKYRDNSESWDDLIPGMDGFSPTNKSRLMILPVGREMKIAGYAKLAIQNGNTNKFGYLGQYFEQAYQIDTNGVATTNTTDILSPYGDFFATEAGAVALVTMPDPDTGVQGTCTVYCVGLQLDANHDGNMDLSFNGTDATSPNLPFVFWANNNYDRLTLDADDNAFYDDDVATNSSAAWCPYISVPTPDCNYLNGSGNRVIPCARDLQDFTRLWVCGITSNLLVALPAGSTVTLNWGDVGSPNYANPTIDLFSAADPDGGIGYLTNSSAAESQIDSSSYPYIQRLAPGGSIQLNASTFANNWAGNHFIWCGVSNGSGGLNLTIADASGNVLAQTTTYIQIVDIKQMYERWTVGDNSSVTPTTNVVLATDGLPFGASAFQYVPQQITNTPYILLVHGWNDETWEKDRFAESAFKRLYWQGYHGRFGEFRWPTTSGFTGSFWQALTDPRNYDNGEYQAWQSAAGLLNLFTNLQENYGNNVYVLAHSMGNVVTGEALRLAAQSGAGQLVNTYVASQAALPAHDYDATVTTPYLLSFNYTYPTEPIETLLGNRNYGPFTPNIYGNRLTNNIAAVGKRISYYNENDFALAAPRWGFDQITKPDYIPPNSYYAYSGSSSDPAPWNHFVVSPIIGGTDIPIDIVTNLNNCYKIMAYAAQSYSTALGATPIATFNTSVDLTDPANHLWLTDPSGHSYSDHFWHSAEFRGDCWQEWNYWNTLLRSGSEGFNITNP